MPVELEEAEEALEAELPEDLVVAVANAVLYPRAMMIHPHDAFIALPAVVRAHRPEILTYIAKGFPEALNVLELRDVLLDEIV